MSRGGVFQQDEARSPSQRSWTSAHTNDLESSVCAQILHGDQTSGHENVPRLDHTPAALVKVFITQMLRRDLFAVSNLLV